ncbi:MAG: hypothetical protein IT323_01235 [Anaerolineae bacterium]|nr:hypothetical protein [Anaerolineae bacterium]
MRADQHAPSVDVITPDHVTCLDNTKAKFLLGGRPVRDLTRTTDGAFAFQRGVDEARVIYYPG